MSVAVSAVVCTYNRAGYLRQAIRSLVQQRMSPAEYQIVVVDNGSSDETKRVVETEFSAVTNLVYVFEPTQGLTHARNAGFRRADGRYVAYLDDDAVADPSWLATILEAFGTVRPTPGCVGGRIVPLWEAPRPRWLADGMLSHLTIVDWSAEPVTLGERQFLAGANMAFPRRVLEETDGFRTVLGLARGRLLYNDEILLENEIRRRGYTCFYRPDAVVQHHVPASRLVQRYFTRRYYWQGVSDAVLELCERPLGARDRVRAARAHARGHLGRWRSWFHLLRPTTEPGRFQRKCELRRDLGYVVALLSTWKWRDLGRPLPTASAAGR